MSKSTKHACIDTCIALLRECAECATAHFGESNPNECVQAVRECVEASTLCAPLMARDSTLLNELGEHCAKTCERCAAECEKQDHAEASLCAEKFRACAAAWRQRLDT